MEFFTQFGLLFSNMQWYVVVCLVLGLVLLLVEIFQPGFGVFGISGFVLLILSIIFRGIFHKPDDNVLMQIFQLLLLYFIILGSGFGLFWLAHKKNWLKKTPFAHNDTAINPDFSDGTKNFGFLLEKQGKALTELHPSGKAVIDGKIYDVVADFFIPSGENIIVKNVDGIKIGVEKYID